MSQSTTQAATLRLLLGTTFLGLALWCLAGVLLYWLLGHAQLTLAIQLWLGLLVLLALGLVGFVLLVARIRRSCLDQMLDEQHRRNQLIVDTAADAIITFDYHGRIESFNAAASRLFGYQAEEIIGQDVSKLIQAQGDWGVDSYLRKAITTGSGRVLAPELTFHGVHRDGRIIPIELGVSKAIDESRHVYVQIIRDRTEHELIERHRQIHVESARILGGDEPIEVIGSALLEVIGKGFGWSIGTLWLVDLTADHLRVAATWTADTSAEAFLERHCRTPLGHEVGLAGKVWASGLARYAADVGPPPWQGGLAFPVTLAEETLGVLEFYHLKSAQVMDSWDRSLMPIAMQLAQFLQRGRTRESLRRAKELAEQASQAKTEFLANVSHEIRTPLNGILGLTELMLTEAESPRQLDNLRLIESSAATLLNLINDLLDLAKIEAARMTLEARPFQLRESLEPTLRTLAVRAEQKGLKLSWLIHSDVPTWLIGDPLRLQQILQNLIGNAIKFTLTGEIQVRLAIAARTLRDVVLHGSIRDTGIGIPREKQDQIFDAFYQVESSRSRRFGGTGLGLSITAQLLALMGGRIWVESIPDQGSTFYFTACLMLPESGITSSDFSSASDVIPRTPSLTAPRGKRLLVAEDNPVNRVLLDLILQKRQHRVTYVGSGNEVLSACANEEFDLILMDLQLPEMDGLEATQQLKRRHVRFPLIVGLTARTDEESQRACMEAGMVAYLTKPVQPGDLLHVIDNVLRSKS